MKLLLTSGGLTNECLRNAVRKLVGSKKIKIAFIPTAANVEKGEKKWLINDYVYAQKVGVVDIVDISAVPKKIWLPRLKEANVIIMGGGNTFHLMYWLRKSGLAKLLPGLLKTRVYVGISAGSMVTNPTLSASQSKILYYEDLKVTRDMKGMSFVDFFVRPHLNASFFPQVRISILAQQMDRIPGDLYALDDDCAVQVVDGKVTVIAEGKWKLFRK